MWKAISVEVWMNKMSVDRYVIARLREVYEFCREFEKLSSMDPDEAIDYARYLAIYLTHVVKALMDRQLPEDLRRAIDAETRCLPINKDISTMTNDEILNCLNSIHKDLCKVIKTVLGIMNAL